MKFLSFSDLHSANYKAFANYKTGINSRLQDILSCIDKIQRIGKTEDVDFYIFPGDLFNTQGYVENDVFNLTYDAFSKFDKPVICVPGNHDNYGSDKSFNVSFQKFNSLPNITILDYASCKGFYGVGYHKKLDLKRIQETKERILIIHDTPKGFNLKGYIFEEGVDWRNLEKQFDLVLFGHIHQPKKLSEKTYVIGSPLEHSFSDSNTGDKGVWLFDVNGEVKSEFIPLKFPKFIKADTLTDDIKRDKFNYYMILNSIEKPDSDNIVVSEKVDKIETQSRLGNTSMNNEAIISKYLEVTEVKEKELPGFKKYGSEVLNKASEDVLSIAPSNYRLHNIVIEGFLSFRDKMEFTVKDGIWLVVGKSEVFTSNGAGKTSLFDAIFWCLYGRTSKNIASDDVINDNMGKDCKVTLELKDGDNNVVISRFRKYKKDGNGVSVIVDGNSLDGHASMLDKKIVNLLGYDYDFFLNTIYYSQEKTEFFSSSTDANKKSFLDVVLQFERYSSAVKMVRNDLSVVDKDIESSNVRVLYIKKEIIEIGKRIEEYSKLEEVFEETRNEEIVVLKNKASEVQAALEVIDKFCSTITTNFEESKKKYNKITKSVTDLLAEKVTKINKVEKDISTTSSDIRNLESNKDKIMKKISTVESSEEGAYCDSCGSVIDAEIKKEYINREMKEVVIIKDKLLLLIEAKSKMVDSIVTLEDEYNKDINEYKEVQEALNSKVEKLDKEIREKGSRKTTLEYEIKKIQDTIDNRLGEINVYSVKIKEQEGFKSEKVNELFRLSDCYKANEKKKQMYEFWEQGFSNKGIKSLLLDDFCNLFNNEVISSINLLSNGCMAIGLTNQTKLKSGVMSEKLSLVVKILGATRNYEHLSGGEKRRVDIAIIITLNKIIRNMYNISSGMLGVLILDEVFSFLDGTGEENVFCLLKEVAKDIKSIFVITHTDELESCFDKTITIVKKDRCSYIENS